MGNGIQGSNNNIIYEMDTMVSQREESENICNMLLFIKTWEMYM